MKQKMIYIVLVVACIYMPSSSKECGKVCAVPEQKAGMPAKNQVSVDMEELSSLPASPFLSALFNL